MKRFKRIRYLRHLSRIIKNKRLTKHIRELPSFLINRDNQCQLFSILRRSRPLKIEKCELPSFKWPKAVKTVISDNSKRKQQMPTIPYQQQEQQEGVMLSQIPFEEFINYKGNLDLSIAQMKLEEDQVIIPSFVKHYFTTKRLGAQETTIEAINLWSYKGDRLSTWHYDGHDNFLFMLEGSKNIHLMPPNQSQIQPKEMFNVNNNHGDKSSNSLIPSDRYCSCELKQGQCVFIPRGWWHQIRSFGNPSTAINIWGNSLSKCISQDEQDIMLRHLVLTISERLCSKMEGWEELPQKIKQKYRRTCFQIHINKHEKSSK